MSWRVLKHIHCFCMSFTHDILKRPATNPGILVLMGGYIRIYVGILINHDGHPYESANEHIQQCILTVKQCSCVNLLKKKCGFFELVQGPSQIHDGNTSTPVVYVCICLYKYISSPPRRLNFQSFPGVLYLLFPAYFRGFRNSAFFFMAVMPRGFSLTHSTLQTSPKYQAIPARFVWMFGDVCVTLELLLHCSKHLGFTLW